MKFYQSRLTVASQAKSIQLITDAVSRACPWIGELNQGLLQVFIQHTSASLSINENSDAAVRSDLAMALDQMAPESLPYEHDEEGADDMPAHVKASLMGACVLIPIVNGKMALGTWQGIYLCEHRSASHKRELLCSGWGI